MWGQVLILSGSIRASSLAHMVSQVHLFWIEIPDFMSEALCDLAAWDWVHGVIPFFESLHWHWSAYGGKSCSQVHSSCRSIYCSCSRRACLATDLHADHCGTCDLCAPA